MLKGAYPRLLPSTIDNDVVLDLAFDEGTGQKVFDTSGHNNHGTLVNMAESDWVSGIGGRGRALEFDGVNDYVEVNSVADGGFFGGDFTMSGWGKLAVWGVDQVLLSPSRLGVTTPYASLGFDVASQKLYARVHTAAAPISTVLSLAVYTNDSDWHYYRSVVNAAGHIVAFYIDGIYQGANVANAHDLSTINGFYLGQLPWNVPNIVPWNGRISEVTVFGGILTASEVLRSYEQPRIPLRVGHQATLTGTAG